MEDTEDLVTGRLLDLIKEAAAFMIFHSKGLNKVNSDKMGLWLTANKHKLKFEKNNYILTMADCKDLFHYFALDIKDFDIKDLKSIDILNGKLK